MKKLLLSALPLFIAFAMLAQKGNGTGKGQSCDGPHMHKGMPGKGPGMMKDLNLTEDQKKQMQTLQKDFQVKMKDLNAKENITVKQQRDQREALLKAHRQDVESVLTAEQRQKMTTMKAQQAESRSARAQQNLDRMTKELNLTADQAAKIKANQQQMHEKMMAIHNNESLDRTARQAQVKALMEASKKNMEQVLTKEQQEKWQTMRPGMQGKHPMKGRGGQGRGAGPGPGYSK